MSSKMPGKMPGKMPSKVETKEQKLERLKQELYELLKPGKNGMPDLSKESLDKITTVSRQIGEVSSQFSGKQ